MDSKMSLTGLINIGNKASNLASFISFILWCICHSCIITFQDFYSFLRRFFQILSFLFFNSCKSLWAANTHEANIGSSNSKKPCPIREVRVEMPFTITRDDIEIVMENLGLFRDANERRPQGLVEIVSLFDKREPSLDEVREAFGIFDQNRDGFIDADELKKVMSSIGLMGFTMQECQRMIMAFDENGDGRIDFGEFVKLMEECS